MPGFSPLFFLSSSNMATGCDRRSLDPLRGSLECTQLGVAVVVVVNVGWGVLYDVRVL